MSKTKIFFSILAVQHERKPISEKNSRDLSSLIASNNNSQPFLPTDINSKIYLRKDLENAPSAFAAAFGLADLGLLTATTLGKSSCMFIEMHAYISEYLIKNNFKFSNFLYLILFLFNFNLELLIKYNMFVHLGNEIVKRESPHMSDEEDSAESDVNEESGDALSWAREKTLKESLDLLSKLLNEVNQLE